MISFLKPTVDGLSHNLRILNKKHYYFFHYHLSFILSFSSLLRRTDRDYGESDVWERLMDKKKELMSMLGLNEMLD